MLPSEQAPAGLTEDSSHQANAESGEGRTDWDLDNVDLDALAVKILELMRRELRIELERKGRTR